MTDLATPHATDGTGPEPAPPHLIDPPSVRTDGVELTRLIDRAQLTIAQAVELASAVASELTRRCGSGVGAHAPAGPVLIGADGRVVPGTAGTASAAGPGTGELLPALADAVRFRARIAGPAAEQLLAGLDRAVTALPDAGLPAVARMLREPAGAIDRRTVRAEIGALVRAIGADAAETAPAEARPAPAGTAGSAGTGRARTVRRRAGAWLLSLLALTGVVLLEVGFLRGHISSDVGALLDAGHGGSAPTATATATSTAAPATGGLPVAAPAPASAGPVAGLDLRPLQPCMPGAACTVRLEIRLTATAEQQVVTWSYLVVDRCTGASQRAQGGSVTLAPADRRAAVVSTVSLPAGPGVALLAVTERPAAAASAPLVLGSCTSHR